MEELVIIGGGVAGLSGLNALLDNHISPLLLEASTIGTPKMCGEFLAPPVMDQLKKWGIGPMQSIKQARFNDLQCSFPREAGGYSRHDAEIELAARAKKLGGRIIEQSPIQTIIPATQNSPYILHLNSGETIEARDVIFASGKFSQTAATSTYVGFKTYIPQVIQSETLLMFSLAGGYLGIVPVTDDMSNLTCLVRRDEVEKAGSCKAFLESIHPSLGAKTGWLEGPAPTFSPKTIPNWPHAYWIGDAFASIHPAIGYGFAHSIISALLAVEYYLKQDPVGYHQALKKLMRPKRIIGKTMHHLLQKPRLCSVVSPIFERNPWITHQLLSTLGY